MAMAHETLETEKSDETEAPAASRPRPSRVPALCIRPAFISDLVPLVVLSSEFFAEANWKEFTSFNHEGMKQHFENVLMRPFEETGHFIYVCDLLPYDGVGEAKPIGFIKCCIQWSSTTEPLGVLDAVYINRNYRLSHAGRSLFYAAEARLRELGACAFFAAPGARLGGVDKSMSNMLGRLGFEVQVSHGCKILRGAE
jgi:hypothetical protein